MKIDNTILLEWIEATRIRMQELQEKNNSLHLDEYVQRLNNQLEMQRLKGKIEGYIDVLDTQSSFEKEIEDVINEIL